ncbi:carboxypeptidase-like regulatory domain-containing protein [Flavobacterium pedocola]
MTKRIGLLLFLVSAFTASAQLKGIVKDSLTGKPIPYVSVWLAKGTTGTTSDENGTFSLNLSGDDKKVIVSALGYQRETVTLSAFTEILLQPASFELKEMIISKWKGTKQRVIGETENSICQAFDNAPPIDIKYFPYSEAYRKTKFIKTVSLYTDCRIDDVLLKLHFYAVDANGYPGTELLQQDYIVPIKKGVGKSNFNISDLGLKMPANGIFVGFEKLMLERNRTDTKYFPLVLYNYVAKESQFIFLGGKWERKTQKDNRSNDTGKAFEPALNLTLTN